MLALSGSDRVSPDLPSSTGSSPEEDLSSTTHRSAGRWVEGWAVTALGGERGVHGAAGVYDEGVAGTEELREVGEPGVDYAVVAQIRDHQADFVAAQSSRLRRLSCLQLRRQLEMERGSRLRIVGKRFYGFQSFWNSVGQFGPLLL